MFFTLGKSQLQIIAQYMHIYRISESHVIVTVPVINSNITSDYVTTSLVYHVIINDAYWLVISRCTCFHWWISEKLYNKTWRSSVTCISHSTEPFNLAIRIQPQTYKEKALT